MRPRPENEPAATRVRLRKFWLCQHMGLFPGFAGILPTFAGHFEKIFPGGANPAAQGVKSLVGPRLRQNRAINSAA